MPILAAQTSSSLLALTVLSLLVPAAFAASTPADKVKEGILALSHGTAIVLLIIYILFLFFQVRIVTQTIVNGWGLILVRVSFFSCELMQAS